MSRSGRKLLPPRGAVVLFMLARPVLGQDPAETFESVHGLLDDARACRTEDRIDEARAALAAALQKLAAIDGADARLDVVVERWKCGTEADLLGPSRSCLETARAAWGGVVAYYEGLAALDQESTGYLQSARGQLARALEALGDRADAIAVQERSVATWQRGRGAKDPATLAARQELARLLCADGRVKDGSDVIRAVIVDLGSATEADVDERAREWTVRKLADAGRFTEALGLQEELLQRVRQRSGDGGEETLLAREQRAVTLGRLGRYDEAYVELDALVELWKQHHPGALGLHFVQENYANLLVEQGVGWDDRIRTLYRAALGGFEAARARGEVDTLTVETCRGELATGELFAGRFVEARELAQLALERMVADPALGPDHPAATWPRAVLGQVAAQLGDFRTALDDFRANLAVRRAVLPPRHPDLLLVMRTVGWHLRLVGELEAAERLLRAVVDAIEDEPEALSRDLRSAWTIHAWVLVDLGRTEEAVEQIRHAMQFADSKDPPALAAETHAELAHALLADEDYEGARKEYRASLPLLRPYYNFFDYSVFAREYGLLLAEAKPTPKLTAELTEQLRDLLAFSREQFGQCVCLPPRQSIEHAKIIDLNAQFVLSLAARTSAAEDLRRDAFELLESLRGIALHSARLFARTGDDPAVAKLRRNAAASAAELQARIFGRAGPTGSAATKEVLEEVRKKEREQFLALRAAVARTGNALPELTVAALAAKLPKDEAIVAFRRTHGWKLEDGEVSTQPRLLAHLVVPGTKGARLLEPLDLGDADDIDAKARAWLAEILGFGGPDRSDGSRKTPPGVELRQAVLDPVFSALRRQRFSTGTLHLCLDGDLHRVPLDALPAPDPRRDPRLMGEREYAFVYETSLLRLATPPPPVRADPSLLLVGDVDYGADHDASAAPPIDSGAAAPPVERGGGGDDWTKLDSGAEIQAVHDAFLAGKAAGTVVELRGGEATKASFIQDVVGRRFIHVATHGDYLRDALDIADRIGSDVPAIGEMNTIVRGYAPMTLCYLVFAGANQDRHELLTAEEIAQLDLSSCELAVLSACSTAEGELAPGHGVQSLQTALHIAGARSVITTRWGVNNVHASELMALFYQELWKNGGQSKAEALQRAKIRMRKQAGIALDLKAWAAFVLTGDPD